MALILPDIFTPLVQGLELGRNANWDDLQKYNTVQAGQIGNALALETFDPTVNNAYNQAAINQNNRILSDFGVQQQALLQPGNLFNAQVTSDAQESFAQAIRNLEASNRQTALQQQQRELNAQLQAPVQLPGTTGIATDTTSSFSDPNPLINAATITPQNAPGLFPAVPQQATTTDQHNSIATNPTLALGLGQPVQTAGTTEVNIQAIPDLNTVISPTTLATLGIDGSRLTNDFPMGSSQTLQEQNGQPVLTAYRDNDGTFWLVWYANGQPTRRARYAGNG